MTTRSIWIMPAAGSLDRLVRREEPLAPPQPGEARVRVEAIGLNFADVFACLGLYSATPKGPFVPGLECAGTIEALGPPRAHASDAGTRSLRVGDRVMAITRFGGFATALNIDTRSLAPVPAGWTTAQAAALPVQALTAWYGLVHLGGLSAGHVVLVHSAAGGVGLHALAMADSVGATVIATVGRPEKTEFLAARRIPRDRIIVRDPRRFREQVDAALGVAGAQGFDLVFDAVAGPYFVPALARLQPEGRYVVYGAADFMPAGTRPNWVRLTWQYMRRPRVDPMRLIDRNRSVMGFNLIWLFDRSDRLPQGLQAARRLSPAAPHVGHTFPFAEVPRALRTLQSGRTIGKVVVEV